MNDISNSSPAGMFPEYLYPLISQLDLACELVNSSNPVRHRASIILCDNLIELAAQQIGRDELSMFLPQKKVDLLLASNQEIDADIEQRGFPPKFNNNTWEDWDNSKSQDFNSKLRFLRKQGRITEMEQSYLGVMHRYRNDLYHKGLRWESALESLALIFHEFSCNFVARIAVHWLRFGSGQNFTGQDSVLFIEIEKSGWESLGSVFELRRKKSTTLSDNLCSFLHSVLDGLDKDISFIAEVNFEDKNEIEAINMAFFISTLSEEEIIRTEIKTFTDFAVAITKKGIKILREGPRPPLRRRVDRLRREQDPIRLVLNFSRLHREIELIAHACNHAATVIDDWVEAGVDAARGK